MKFIAYRAQVESIRLNHLILKNIHPEQRWAIYIKKVYYIEYTDTHRYLLKICNIHILREFWKIDDVQYTVLSKSIFNVFSE